MTTIELVANDQLLQVTVNPTISSGTGTEVEPTPDIYQQLLTAYENMKGGR